MFCISSIFYITKKLFIPWQVYIQIKRTKLCELHNLVPELNYGSF